MAFWRMRLTCNGSHWQRAHTPDAVHSFILPEACESVGCHGGRARRMLRVLMPQVVLDGPDITPLRREVIAAGAEAVGHAGRTHHPAWSQCGCRGYRARSLCPCPTPTLLHTGIPGQNGFVSIRIKISPTIPAET